MSGRNKRKLTDDEEEVIMKSPKMEDVPAVSSRSGRARKKSAKLLEMEAFEEEIAGASKSNKAAKKRSSMDSSDQIEAIPIAESPKKSPKSAVTTKKKSTVGFKIETKKEDTSPLEDSFPDAPPIKMVLTLPKGVKKEEPASDCALDPVTSQSESETEIKQEKTKSKSKKKTGKKSVVVVDDMPEIDEPQVLPPKSKKSSKKKKAAETLPEVQVKEETTTDIATTDKPEENEAPDQAFNDDEDAPLVVDEETEKKKKKSKKKKKIPARSDPALLNYEAIDSSKMEILDYADFVDNIENNLKEEEVKAEEGKPALEVEDKALEAVLPETSSGAKKVRKKKPTVKASESILKKKSSSTAAGFFSKERKEAKRIPLNKAEKVIKRRTTAYTLWCNNMRRELMLQYPELDFAQISKKLAELWQTVSVQEKNTLRRRAKKIQKKQDEGKDVTISYQSVSTHMRSGVDKFSKRMVLKVSPGSQSNYQYKVVGNAPIDVAAHLKLLGESLGTIGARLQEHRGQIAVQGSLSVLLDSMLCALGPLMCLTNQVPELNSVPEHVHKVTLDNVAYIMPGIG